MNFIARKTKVFAILFLIFGNSFPVISQRPSVYRLPVGTRIRLSMDAGISSEISSVNDTFTASVAKPITVENVVVLPSGTVIEGRITRVGTAGFGGKNGHMSLRFETIRFPDSRRRTIDGVLANELKPASSRTVNLVSIFAGSAAGAVIGALSGKQNGAALGAGIGAGAGTAAVLIKKGRDVSIKTNEEFAIELTSEVTLPASDY